MDLLGVYIHIPFCVRKCAYCDFLSVSATRKRQQKYVAALKREIICEAEKYITYEIQTIFLGGGTPSILNAEEIAGILECLREHYRIKADVEITMEMNPGTADCGKLLTWKKAGINRLSIGLQSTDDTELKLLGRIHTYDDFLRTYHQAREAGFTNINIDLISALPGQDVKTWVQTLEKVAALQPEHISAYSLIIEEGTRLYRQLGEYPPVPDEDEERLMDQATKRILSQTGYHRYEISNYAKEGYECRHNCIYWQRGVGHITDYVGFGLGASSMVDNTRWKNTEDMERYLYTYIGENTAEYGKRTVRREDLAVNELRNGKEGEKENIKKDIQKLTKNDCMEEFMFLGLRMMKGVSKSEFADSFGIGMSDIYGEVLCKWEKQGMLLQNDDYVRLTEAGIDVSNMVFADFLL